MASHLQTVEGQCENLQKAVEMIYLMVTMTRQIAQLMINPTQVRNRDSKEGPRHPEKANNAIFIQEREFSAVLLERLPHCRD